MTALVLPSADDATPTFAVVPVPEPAEDEMLVQVRAVGVGVHDVYFLPQVMRYPYPIGIEAAGVVVRVGSAVSGHTVGDRIAFVSIGQSKGGVWAQYAALGRDSVMLPIPDELSFEQASAIPVAATAALRALHALPPIGVGGSLFVAGASGAVGSFAVQLAHARGWQVAASASTGNHDYLRSLGASLAVDYRDPEWSEKVRQWKPAGVDGALAVQPQTTAGSARVVKGGGTVVTVSGDSDVPAGVRVTGLDYHVDVRTDIIKLIDDIVAGDVQLIIERVYPFHDALDALAKVQTRHSRGKIVLSLL